MGQETPTITVDTRERTGTRYSQRLRQSGRLPAVIYGKGKAPVHVSVDELSMIEALQSGAHVMEISIDGASNEKCLVKDLQFGWLGDNLIHLDLTRVDLDEIVTVNVQVTLTGTAKVASGEGALLEVVRREIEVSCRVADIPGELKYDITNMEEAVTIGDLPIPPEVTPVLDLDKHICHVTFVQQEEAEGEETEVDAEGTEPEVIAKPKDEDADAGEASEEGD